MFSQRSWTIKKCNEIDSHMFSQVKLLIGTIECILFLQSIRKLEENALKKVSTPFSPVYTFFLDL